MSNSISNSHSNSIERLTKFLNQWTIWAKDMTELSTGRRSEMDIIHTQNWVETWYIPSCLKDMLELVCPPTGLQHVLGAFYHN